MLKKLKLVPNECKITAGKIESSAGKSRKLFNGANGVCPKRVICDVL